MAETSLGRLARACGWASPGVAALGIATAWLAAPAFDPVTGALSDLGVTAGAAPFFNGGLLVAGALGLAFAWYLWIAAGGPVRRAGALTFGGAVVGLAGVGAFPAGSPLHLPAAVSFYALATYALFLWGSGLVRDGETGRGLGTVWLGVLHVTVWLAWGVALVPLGVTGLAVPETGGAAIVAGWAVTTARRRPRTP